MADNTVWNSKGLLEWSRFVRNYVAEDKQDDTEEVVKSLRSMGEEIVYISRRKIILLYGRKMLL